MSEIVESINKIISSCIVNNVTFSMRHYKKDNGKMVTEIFSKDQNVKILFPKLFKIRLDSRQTSFCNVEFEY